MLLYSSPPGAHLPSPLALLLLEAQQVRPNVCVSTETTIDRHSIRHPMRKIFSKNINIITYVIVKVYTIIQAINSSGSSITGGHS